LIERTIVAPQDTQLYVTSSKPLVNSKSLGFEGVMAVLHSGHFMVGKLRPILVDLAAMWFFSHDSGINNPPSLGD
jgi:hypothetical protein